MNISSSQRANAPVASTSALPNPSPPAHSDQKMDRPVRNGPISFGGNQMSEEEMASAARDQEKGVGKHPGTLVNGDAENGVVAGDGARSKKSWKTVNGKVSPYSHNLSLPANMQPALRNDMVLSSHKTRSHSPSSRQSASKAADSSSPTANGLHAPLPTQASSSLPPSFLLPAIDLAANSLSSASSSKSPQPVPQTPSSLRDSQTGWITSPVTSPSRRGRNVKRTSERPPPPSQASGLSFAKSLNAPAFALSGLNSPLRQYPTAQSPSSPKPKPPPPLVATASPPPPESTQSITPASEVSSTTVPPLIPSQSVPLSPVSLAHDVPAPESPAQTPSATAPSSRATSPRPPMKPKSWADLVRPSNTSPATSAAPSVPNSTPTSPSASLSALTSPAAHAAHLDDQAVGESKKKVSFVVPGKEGVRSPGQETPSSPTPGSPSIKPIRINPEPKPKTLLADILEGIENKFSSPFIHPRGLINNGNLCFANSILQVLVHCGPFFNLLSAIQMEIPHSIGDSKTPLMDAMIMFKQEFRPVSKDEMFVVQGKAGEKHLSPPIAQGWSDPFVPELVYESMKHNKRFEAMRRGTQEDAEEFLGFFLDSLHEEISAAIERHDKPLREGAEPNGIQTPAPNGHAGDEDEWLEVGSRGRTAVTRTTETKQSPITIIFGGKQRSVVRCQGQKDSVRLEPYQSLQLDIQPEHVKTIEDALLNLSTPEVVHDFSSKGGVRVDAMKQVFIETLPPILIIHLKRFLYDKEGGIQKSHKIVSYGTTLQIPNNAVAPSRRTRQPIRYDLSAVVYHHGKSAAGGHYTTNLRQQSGNWINIDDTTIRPVLPGDVAVDRERELSRLGASGSPLSDPIPDKSAYLLIYTRYHGL